MKGTTVNTDIDKRIDTLFKQRSEGHTKTRKIKTEILTDLSQLLGIGKPHLYKIRKNEYGMSLSGAKKVADYFGCTVDDLIIEDAQFAATA
jgi:DNA-binding XRE family transcriptional regulator